MPGIPAPLPPPAPRRPRIVVAEDSNALRALIAATLCAEGYDVVEAGNGVELVSIVERLHRDGTVVDLIVSDLRMPELSGMDVLGELHRQGIRIPYILVTAFGDDETHRDARHLGAVAVLDKPFDLDCLCAVVGAAMEPPRHR